MSGEERRAPAAPPRLFGLDTARGLALFGMFAAHVLFGGEEHVWDGRSSILFATVAGVSLGLLTGGAAPPPRGARTPGRLVIALRGAVLVVLGLLLTLPRPPLAVILDYYGVAFLLLVPVLFARRAVLAVLAGVVAFGAPPLVAALTGAWDFADVPEGAQPLARWLVWGEYPILVWLAFFLVGLVLARSDLARRATALAALGGGTAAAIAGYGIAALVPGVTAEAHSGTTAEVLGSGGLAVAIVGLLSLLDSASGRGAAVARVARVVLHPVSAAGSMVLSLYTVHVVVLTVVRDLVRADSGWTYPAWVLPALIGGALVGATLWRRFVGTGPLEAGLRALTRAAVRDPREPGDPAPPRVTP